MIYYYNIIDYVVFNLSTSFPRYCTRSFEDGRSLQKGTVKSVCSHIPVHAKAEQYIIQNKMDDPIAFASKDGIDMLHYGQAMKADNRNNFVTAMIKEVKDHVDREHWEIVPILEVPKGHKVLDLV